VSSDASELGGLADDLMAIPTRLVPKIKPIVARSAMEVKKIMRADAAKSQHFKQIGRTINYDLNVFEFAGDASIEAEIGPDKGVAGAASLAGIAYYGGAHGGGGTVRDPVDALLEVAPDFLEYIGQAVDGVL
jgi:hypothetical protein